MHRAALGLGLVAMSTILLTACDAPLFSEEDTQTCTLIGCGGGPTLEAHLQTTREALSRATTRVCVDDACDDLVVSGEGYDPSSNVDPNFGHLSGAKLYGAAMLIDEGQGWMTLAMTVITGTTSSADASRVGIAIFAADGSSLMNVSRTATLETSRPNGPRCEPTCRGGTIALYADSPSDVTCSSKACDAGFRWKKTVRWSDRGATADVRLCRGEACVSAVARRGSEFGSSQPWSGGLAGMLATEGVSASETRLTVRMDAETRTLADGDGYTVTVTERETGTVLASFDAPVTYDETFPNGPTCDPHPCRSVQLEEP